MIQGKLFEDETAPAVKRAETVLPETGLIISQPQKSILTKQQQTFNKLITKIETLRLDLSVLKNSMDEKLSFYVKYIYPLEQQIIDLNKEMIKLFYRFFTNKKLLSVKQRNSLRTIISTRLNDILQHDKSEPDDHLKEIFKAVEGMSYEEAVEEDFSHLKSEMGSMFQEFGFDMDFDDLHSKMTEQELLQKAIEMQEEFRRKSAEHDNKRATRKKTKRQKEIEEKEKQIKEARTKNIGSIYRQLAKVFHPDLEQDELLKLEKEELMKQLTIAYENNDLHTLLSLELGWIKKEENTTDKLADDKLSIYNEVLKEQVCELEGEMVGVLQQPRYQPLHRFALFPHLLNSINFKDQKQQFERRKSDLVNSIAILEGDEKQSVFSVKKMIREFEQPF